ncbi:transcription factor GTE4 [Capsicum chacoense]
MDSDLNDLNPRNSLRWGDNYKVYTRKRRRKTLENTNTDDFPANTAAVSSAAAEPDVTCNGGRDTNENDNVPEPSLQNLDAEKAESPEQLIQAAAEEEGGGRDVPEAIGGGSGAGEVPEGSSGTLAPTQNHRNKQRSYNLEVENGYIKPVISRIRDRIRINLTGVKSRDDIRELSMSFKSELDQVRSLVNELEAKQIQLTTCRTSINGGSINAGSITTTVPGGSISSYSHPGYIDNGVIKNRSLARMHSGVRSAGHIGSRPFQQPSFLTVENSNGSNEFMEKEKRIPKANQYYRNSEFLLGKDRLPPESNKRFKPNGSGRHSANSENGFAFVSGFDKHRLQVFRNCSSLLQRLMKHQHGWVFNEPVNAEALGLHDYHDIIKHPMDLGTIKTRLSENWYKFPREFAEDVRLVFRNAMTYNPKGQDVHVMAEHLSGIFEERWAVIEAEYNSDWRQQTYPDGSIPTPTSRMTSYAPPFFHTPVASHSLAPHAHQLQTLARSESMTRPVGRPKMKTSSTVHVARTPAPKKPKAKDPNKRDMTYEEKQKLSTNLQNLPSEKLDAIVQIIKKRNSALSQDNDEIEVDIDSVDAETLWELDRFVTNFRKSFSKYKRKAELARAREEAAQTARIVNATSVVADAPKQNGTGEKDTTPATLTEGGKPLDSASRSSSSSSSSSDSGSSSSDSDSDSSSASGSDVHLKHDKLLI